MRRRSVAYSGDGRAPPYLEITGEVEETSSSSFAFNGRGADLVSPLPANETDKDALLTENASSGNGVAKGCLLGIFALVGVTRKSSPASDEKSMNESGVDGIGERCELDAEKDRERGPRWVGRGGLLIELGGVLSLTSWLDWDLFMGRLESSCALPWLSRRCDDEIGWLEGADTDAARAPERPMAS